MSGLVEIHQPTALIAPESSLLGPDGKQQPGTKLVFPFVRTRSDVRSMLNKAADQYGNRFIQGTFKTIFIPQEAWDVLDMAQQEAAARADAAGERVD